MVGLHVFHLSGKVNQVFTYYFLFIIWQRAYKLGFVVVVVVVVFVGCSSHFTLSFSASPIILFFFFQLVV